MNRQGYINIVGRVKDMVIRGGENIFPAEIEAFFMRHPKLRRPRLWGCRIRSWAKKSWRCLRLRPDEQADEVEMRQYCKSSISHQKTPKYIRFVESFPMTASGKVKKFELRKQLIKELNLEEVANLKMA
jgi:fatty-acyl-CoA synthase